MLLCLSYLWFSGSSASYWYYTITRARVRCLQFKNFEINSLTIKIIIKAVLIMTKIIIEIIATILIRHYLSYTAEIVLLSTSTPMKVKDTQESWSIWKVLGL